MSTAKRVIKNTGFLYAKMGITMFISLYTTRLILNALGTSDFGVFNIVGGAVAMLGFFNSAMAGSTQRFMSYSEGEGDKEKQKKIFNISLIIHFFIAIFLGISLFILESIFFTGVLNIPKGRVYAAHVIYYSMIISTMFTVMTVPYEAVLNAHENMLYHAIIGIFESILKLIIALTVSCFFTDKLATYGILIAMVPLCTLTIMRIYCHHNYEECKFYPQKYFDMTLMRQMGSFAGWNFLTSASGIISQYGMGIVLNYYWGSVLNAAQGIVNQISGQLMTFSQVALKVLNPVITKNQGKGNTDIVIAAAFIGSKFSFLIFSLFSIPFIIETPYLLNLWLSETPEWTIIFCRLQLLRILSEQLTISLNSSIYAQGDIKTFTIIKSILNIIPIILTAVLFYFKYPPYTLYIVWIFCWSILGGLLILVFSQKSCNMSYKEYLTNVFYPCTTISIIVLVICNNITSNYPECIIRLIIVFTVSLATHVLGTWLFGINSEEKLILYNFSKKLYKKLY